MRKSKLIGQHVNGYLVLDSKHAGNSTLYTARCDKCGAVNTFTKIAKAHVKCRNCEGGRIDRNGRGHRNEPLYGHYWCMLRRCGNKRGYENVSVCEEWSRDYTKFRDWALENGFEEGLTLDRIDFGGDYSPDNCRWVDARAQANNRKSNVVINLNGRTLTASEWDRQMGFPTGLVSQRRRNGWSGEDSVLTPYGSRKKYSEGGGSAAG